MSSTYQAWEISNVSRFSQKIVPRILRNFDIFDIFDIFDASQWPGCLGTRTWPSPCTQHPPWPSPQRGEGNSKNRSREICWSWIVPEYLVDAPVQKTYVAGIPMYFESIAYRGMGPITGFDDCNCPSFAGATGYGIKTVVPCLQHVFANSSQGTNTVRYVTVLLHPVEKSASWPWHIHPITIL